MKKLNRDTLKYIAIFAMLLDHIAWFFLDFNTPTAQIFHVFGRVTAPLMCSFIADGYVYTKNLKKYAARLLIFAVLSQIPWWLVHGNMFKLSLNMLFTLFFALLAVHAQASCETKAEKVFFITLLCAVTLVCDWYVFAVLWCVIFYKYRDDEKKKYIFFSLVALAYFGYTVYSHSKAMPNNFSAALKTSLFALGSFLSIPLLLSYNGKKGRFKASKWIFYIFYPLHLFIIAVIQIWTGT